MSPSENTRAMNSSGKGHIGRIVVLFRPYRFTVTLVGLLIAIPAITIYSILRNRVARLLLETGILSEGLMSRFQSVGKNK